jgi:hypothetical protein
VTVSAAVDDPPTASGVLVLIATDCCWWFWSVSSDVLLLMSTADVLPRDSHCFHCTGSASVEQPLFVTSGQSGERT